MKFGIIRMTNGDGEEFLSDLSPLDSLQCYSQLEISI